MRENQTATRWTDAELTRLDTLVKRELRKGRPADRSSVLRLLVDREHKRGKRK